MIRANKSSSLGCLDSEIAPPPRVQIHGADRIAASGWVGAVLQAEAGGEAAWAFRPRLKADAHEEGGERGVQRVGVDLRLQLVDEHANRAAGRIVDADDGGQVAPLDLPGDAAMRLEHLTEACVVPARQFAAGD